MMPRLAGVTLGLVLAARAVAAPPEPAVPKLDEGPPGRPAPAEESGARRLPATVAICRDQAAGRCWLVPTGDACGSAEVFRVVIDAPGRTDAADALAQCRAGPHP